MYVIFDSAGLQQRGLVVLDHATNVGKQFVAPLVRKIRLTIFGGENYVDEKSVMS
jgi:hypothetical protein